MADRSQVPAPFPPLRSGDRSPARVKAPILQPPTQDPPANGTSPDTSKLASVDIPGPRKLIRPILSARMRNNLRSRAPLLTASATRLRTAQPVSSPDSSHAETFYLQKQVQAQTRMVFILEDGVRIEGIIEWYDRDAIKVRHGSRTLIYKSSIKYLYKAVESPQI